MKAVLYKIFKKCKMSADFGLDLALSSNEEKYIAGKIKSFYKGRVVDIFYEYDCSQYGRNCWRGYS
jgi:hypothetical protein